MNECTLDVKIENEERKPLQQSTASSGWVKLSSLKGFFVEDRQFSQQGRERMLGRGRSVILWALAGCKWAWFQSQYQLSFDHCSRGCIPFIMSLKAYLKALCGSFWFSKPKWSKLWELDIVTSPWKAALSLLVLPFRWQQVRGVGSWDSLTKKQGTGQRLSQQLNTMDRVIF